MKLSNKQKNVICLIVASPVILILLVAGVCKAYDTWMLNHFEDSLRNDVADMHSSKARCDKDYEATLKYKTENKIALTGTGSPCFIN